MDRFSHSHESDSDVRSSLESAALQHHAHVAEGLEFIAAMEASEFHVSRGYASIHAFYVREYGMGEDEAFEQIVAARAARRFPAIIPAIAEGRLALDAVVLLAPYLTTETADGLLAAAERKRGPALEQMLAARITDPEGGLPRSELEPAGPHHFALRITLARPLQRKLCYAQVLLGRECPPDDFGEVLHRALDALIRHLERGR